MVHLLQSKNCGTLTTFTELWKIIPSPTYRMAGNFRGVLIFVVDLAVTKISTHEN